MGLFIYGTLLHPQLLALIGGPGDGTAQAASLAGHAVDRVAGSVFPMLVARSGATTKGMLWTGLSPAQLERLDIYEIAFGYVRRDVEVRLGDGSARPATAYYPPEGQASAGHPWSYPQWEASAAAANLLAAEEIANASPPLRPAELAARWPMMAHRAEARLRAKTGPVPPATLRHAATAGDVTQDGPASLSGSFFRLAGVNLRHRQFDGTTSAQITREVMLGVDAALVLPYDPQRDRVLLVEQFRSGPFLRHDPNPWTLEPVAGIIDAGESPDEAALRETREEAGLELQSLHPMFAFYASPGESTDYFHCYLGLADLPQIRTYHGGLPEENEDLRLHVLDRAAALALIETGEINAGPLITMLYWLDRNRTRFAASA
jgi:nudix-type nucleoside diphosphatase (YffH/AdpP family)